MLPMKAPGEVMDEAKMKATVDEVTCEGYAKCERIAPEIFKMDDQNIAHVIAETIEDTDQIQRARMAAQMCPVKAILLSE